MFGPLCAGSLHAPEGIFRDSRAADFPTEVCEFDLCVRTLHCDCCYIYFLNKVLTILAEIKVKIQGFNRSQW